MLQMTPKRIHLIWGAGVVLLLALIVWVWPLQPITGGNGCRRVVGRLVICESVSVDVPQPPAKEAPSTSAKK